MITDHSIEVSLFAVAVVLSSTAASAAIRHFSGTLDNVQEQAAGGCPEGSSAMGQVTATLDTATNLMTYAATFGNNPPDYDNGLLDQGTQIVSNFHNSPAGTNGPIVITAPLGSPMSGSETLLASDAAALEAGNIYLQVHSSICVSGEIRGQLTEVAAVPAFAKLSWKFGLIVSLLVSAGGVIWHRRNQQLA